MATFILELFLLIYIMLILAVPVWIILGIIYLVLKHKGKTIPKLSKALKIIGIIILLALPVWIFLLVLASQTMIAM